MKKLISIIFFILIAFESYAYVNVAGATAVGVASANAARRRAEEEKHNNTYHNSIIEGEWKYREDKLNKVFTHKDEFGNKHYIYSWTKEYVKEDMYSCNQHLYRMYSHSEFNRFATTSEIETYEKREKIIMIFFIVLLSTIFIIIIIYVIVKSLKEKVNKTLAFHYD